ncbi:MAG: glycosyltransferase family 9 protein [Bacteroidaceae bacterium]|nr:glycosyltransferase family 9 protein [Bacteroidaceae bacterium]
MAERSKSEKQTHILAMRFSAVGDVAMTVPVLYSLAVSHPECRITFLSNKRFEPMFRAMPGNVHFMGVDLKKDYDGTGGLNRLFNELETKTLRFDMIADLHGVLRTHYLAFRFLTYGYRVRTIRKDRMARKKLTKSDHNGLTPLRTAFDRYIDVFHRLGIDFSMRFQSIHPEAVAADTDWDAIRNLAGSKGDMHWIGIAPFAAFEGKVYPIRLMEKVVSRLDAEGGSRLFVFAYGKEQEQIAGWSEKYRSVVLVNGCLSMWQELLLMSQMEVMLAMDSANMHLASLVGLPVVSVWGATHPAAGFLGYGQSDSDCVQKDMLCRPCSIYGKKPCMFGDYRCMTSIPADDILARLRKHL